MFSVFRSCNNSNNNSSPIHLRDCNEVVYFESGSMPYLELIYNSRIREALFLSVETLTNDSDKSRIVQKNENLLKGKKKGDIKIPRPHNAWIIYRRDKQALLSALNIPLGGNGPTISSSASVKIKDMWHNEPDEVKEYYIALSKLALDNHKKKYGEYKYQPKPRSKALKRSKKQNRSEQQKENISQIPTPVTSSPEPEMLVTPPSPLLTNEYSTTPTTSSSEDFSNEDISTLIANTDSFMYDFELLVPESEHQASLFVTPSLPTTIEGSPEDLPNILAYLNISDITTNESLFVTPSPPEGSPEDLPNILAFPNISDITTNESLFITPSPPTTTKGSPEDLSNILAFPNISDITTNGSPPAAPVESLFEDFIKNASMLAAHPSEFATSTTYDFSGEPLIDPLLTGLTTSQHLYTPGFPLYDSEWQINDEKPYQDQMDFSHNNNGYNAL